MAVALVPLLVGLLCVTLAALADDDCYFPDGTSADGYYMCDPEAENSACCPARDACVSNNICFGNHEGYVLRGLCSDSSWDDPYCPPACTGENSQGIFWGIDVDIGHCGVDIDEDGALNYTLCCYAGVDCCEPDLTFQLTKTLEITAKWDLRYEMYTPATTEVSTVFTSAPFTSTPSSNATMRSSSTTTSPAYESSGSGEGSSDSSYSSYYDEEFDDGGGGISGGAIAGIVVAVLVVIAAIAGYFFWRWRKKRVRQDSDFPDTEGVIAEADDEAAVSPVNKYAEVPGQEAALVAVGEKDGHEIGNGTGAKREKDGIVDEEARRKASYELEGSEPQGKP